jgi:putative SOS response-associated peptidase YedK
MCGRFGMFHTWEDMHAMYGMFVQPFALPARWNIAPKQNVVAIIRAAAAESGAETGGGGGIGDSARAATAFGWGLVPSWAKDPAAGARMINARAETVAEKPSFKAAFARRRCLIPASGFYEWQDRGAGPKQPVWISPPGGGLVTFAGLWEASMGPDGSELRTCTIVTTEANETLQPFHHRMPVILSPDGFDTWLGDGTEGRFDREAALELLRPAPEDTVSAIPVGRGVNDIRNDGPELIEPAAPLAAAPKQGELF